MKKVSISILFIFLITLCNTSFAAVDEEFYVEHVKYIGQEGYSRFIRASVYGFEETDSIELRVGRLDSPEDALVDKISEHKTQNDKYFFVELAAFDVEENLRIDIEDKNDMRITLSTEHFGTGFSGSMGKDYKILNVADTVDELSVINSSLYDVTFETDELGTYAVIYNPYAITLSFMLDDENQHCQIDNLSTSSVIDFPQAPRKAGYSFVGWYQRKNGEGKCLESEMTLGEIASGILYAHWKKNSSGGGSSSKNFTVTFADGESKETVKVKQNATVSEPEVPEKEGYVFDGWYLDEKYTVAYDFSAKVTRNFTLYAKWDKAEESQIILTVGETEAVVNGETKGNDVAPMIKDDRAFLPARFVAESLGAEVLWDAEAKTVTIRKDDTEIILTIGEKDAEINGETVVSDVAPFIENDRTYTPIRLIAEALGADVEWNGEMNKIIITK